MCWWWQREAQRFAEQGDFKAAYETLRDEVGFAFVEVRRDSDVDSLTLKVIELEKTVEAQKERLQRYKDNKKDNKR